MNESSKELQRGLLCYYTAFPNPTGKMTRVIFAFSDDVPWHHFSIVWSRVLWILNSRPHNCQHAYFSQQLVIAEDVGDKTAESDMFDSSKIRKLKKPASTWELRQQVKKIECMQCSIATLLPLTLSNSHPLVLCIVSLLRPCYSFSFEPHNQKVKNMGG